MYQLKTWGSVVCQLRQCAMESACLDSKPGFATSSLGNHTLCTSFTNVNEAEWFLPHIAILRIK